MSARETAELLLLVGRLVQTEGYDGEVSPAQWMALRFFARANSFSRTPSAFAEFQATTRGTASQAIKALEASGYLVRQRSHADERSVTVRGRKYDRSACKQNLYSLSRGNSSTYARAGCALSCTGPRLATTGGSSPHRAELPVSQFPGGAYLCPGDW